MIDRGICVLFQDDKVVPVRLDDVTMYDTTCTTEITLHGVSLTGNVLGEATARAMCRKAKERLNSIYGTPRVPNPIIARVICNDPATVVIWSDGTKTIVKCQDGDEYDPEKGLALCIAKKYFGNTGKYNDIFRQHLPLPEIPEETTVEYGFV